MIMIACTLYNTFIIIKASLFRLIMMNADYCRDKVKHDVFNICTVYVYVM